MSDVLAPETITVTTGSEGSPVTISQKETIRTDPLEQSVAFARASYQEVLQTEPIDPYPKRTSGETIIGLWAKSIDFGPGAKVWVEHGPVDTMTVAEKKGKKVITLPDTTGKPPTLAELPTIVEAVALDLDGAGVAQTGNFVDTLAAVVARLSKNEAISDTTIQEISTTIEHIRDIIHQQYGHIPDSHPKTRAEIAAQQIELSPAKEETVVRLTQELAEMLTKKKEIALHANEENSEFDITSAKVNFSRQIIKEFAGYVTGREINFEKSTEVWVSIEGKTVKIGLPKDATLADIAKIARLLNPEDASLDMPKKTQEFAEKLQHTALLMAQTEEFSDDAIQVMYHASEQLQTLMQPQETVQEKTIEKIQQEANATVFSQEEKEKIYLEMLYGKGVSYRDESGLNQSYHTKQYIVWSERELRNDPYADVSTEKFDHDLLQQLTENNRYRERVFAAVKKSLAQGDAGRAARAMKDIVGQKSGSEQMILQAELHEWQAMVAQAHEKHDVGFTQKMHAEIWQARMHGGTMQQELEAVTRLFQAENFGELIHAPAKALEYLDAVHSLTNGREKNDGCTLLSEYEYSALQQLDYTVIRDVEGTHKFLYVIKDTEVFRIDPSTPLKDTKNNAVTVVAGELKDKILARVEHGDIPGEESTIAVFGYNALAQMYADGKDSAKVQEMIVPLLDMYPTAMGWYLSAQVAPTPELHQQAINNAEEIDPDIKRKWELSKGMIGDVRLSPADFGRIDAASRTTEFNIALGRDEFIQQTIKEVEDMGNANLLNKEYIRSQLEPLVGNSSIRAEDKVAVKKYFSHLLSPLLEQEEKQEEDYKKEKEKQEEDYKKEKNDKDLERTRSNERRDEEPTLFQLSELDKKNIFEHGPIIWFLEISRIVPEFANRWSSGVVPGGAAFRSFESKLQDASAYVNSLDEATVLMEKGKDGVVKFMKEREIFLKLQNDIVNVVLATTFLQDGGDKAIEEVQSKLKSLNYTGVYGIRNLEDGNIGYLADLYLQKLDMRRIRDNGYLQTHSITDVQNEIISQISKDALTKNGKYTNKYNDIKEKMTNKFIEVEYIKKNKGATKQEAKRELDSNAQEKATLKTKVELEQSKDLEELSIRSLNEVIKSHLVVARWTTWAVLDEPAITSKGIPKDKKGDKKTEYTGRPSIWTHMQDMIRWGSLTPPQERMIWGPFQERVVHNALLSLVTPKNKNGKKEVATSDPWHPNNLEKDVLKRIATEIFIDEVSFRSDRVVDSTWRMGDTSGMARPYLDVLFDKLKNNNVKLGFHKNGEWVSRATDTAKEIEKNQKGYQDGMNFGLFLQLHCAGVNTENLFDIRSKRHDLWAGRIAEYFPEIAIKQVYEKHPEEEAFQKLFNQDDTINQDDTKWLEELSHKQWEVEKEKVEKENIERGTNNPMPHKPESFSVILNNREIAIAESGQEAAKALAKNESGRRYRIKLKAMQEATEALKKNERARFRFEIFMDTFESKLLDYRQKGYALDTPVALNFGDSDASTANWVYEINKQFDPKCPDFDDEAYKKYFGVGNKVKELMSKMTSAVHGGKRDHSDSDKSWQSEPRTLAEKLAADPTYIAIYKRTISYSDALLERKEYREEWENDLNNKGGGLAGVLVDLSASEQAIQIFINKIAKGNFNNRDKIFEAIIAAGEIVVGCKGEEYRAKLIDDWAGFYLYSMRLGSKKNLKQPSMIGGFLNFVDWNIASKYGSLTKKEYGANMLSFSDEEIETFVNNELSLYLQADPVRATRLYEFLGIKKGRLLSRGALRLLFALIIGAAMEATGTTPDIIGLS